MVEVFVNGLRTVLRADFEFDFVRQNQFFADAEGYSLEIEFAACPENFRAFGQFWRPETVRGSALLDCVLRWPFGEIRGALSVLSCDDSGLKGQLLEGVVAADEDSDLDKLFVCDLDAGSYPYTRASQLSPYAALEGTSSAVCYPWVSEDYDVVNNRWVDSDTWHDDTDYLSWQPRLLPLVERLLRAAGYSCDLFSLEESGWADAFVCNCLPGIWGVTQFSRALPRWTVRDFLTKLGVVMKGSFIVDESRRHVDFSFWNELERSYVVLHDVVDEFSSTVSREEEDADFLPVRRYRYKRQDLTAWKYLDAPWIHSGNWRISEFNSLSDYLGRTTVGADGHRGGTAVDFAYLKDVDAYFVPRSVQVYSEGHVDSYAAGRYPYLKFTDLQPVNVFGPPEYDSDLSYEELDVVPVVVDYALEGKFMWLPVSSSGDGSTVTDGVDALVNGIKIGNVTLASGLTFGKSRVEAAVENHPYDDSTENGGYFSEVYVGFVSSNPLARPYPITDVDVTAGKTIYYGTRLLRLSVGGAGGVRIDPKVKYEFKFLSDTIPDIQSIFVIRGVEFVCRRITVSVSADGVSEVMTGEFYRVTGDVSVGGSASHRPSRPSAGGVFSPVFSSVFA